MRDPIEQQFELADGSIKTYIITKIPATVGMKIAKKVFKALADKDFEDDDLTNKIFSYVGVKFPNGTIQYLTNEDLINNHVPDWEIGFKIQQAMVEYNCSFLPPGLMSNFLETLGQAFRQ